MFSIVCFGDSITFGVGEKPAQGWVSRLKQYHEPKERYNWVFNLGFPGHTSTDLLECFEAEAKTRVRMKRPTDRFTVLISIGTNDCRWNDPSQKQEKADINQFKKNIEQIIVKAKEFPAKIAFIAITPVDEKRTRPFENEYTFTNERVALFNEVVKDLCQRETVFFIDPFEGVKQEEYASLFEDGVHPNAAGYQLMFERIKEFLLENEMLK